MKSMSSTVERTNEEKVLKILVEQAPVGVSIVQDGKFSYINSYFSIATGYTADELIGKDSFVLVFPEDREMVRENTIRMLKGEILSPYQFRVVCKDGSIIWVMATVRSIQYHGRHAVLGNYMEITGRKQMEDVLKENEEKYRELADSVTDVFFGMDEHLRYTYWNKASEVLTGIRAEDAIGKYLLEIFPDSPGLRRAEKLYRAVLRTQKSKTFVNDFDIDGRHYIFEINAYHSRGGISVFVRDITERIQAEKARKEAEEEIIAFLEEAPVGIIHTDLKGNITYVNKRFESESGYSRKELVGKNGLQMDWFSASTMKYLAERMAARLKGRPAKHWETQFKCKDGQWIWIDLEGKVLRKSGVPIGFQIIARNITDRKMAEEALNLQRAYFQQLFDSSPDAIIMLDINGKLSHANKGFEALFGYSAEEFKGRSPRKFIIPEGDAQKSSTALNGVFSGEVVRRETVRKRKDGSLVDVSVLAYPIRFNDKLVGAYFIYTDITERKQAEEALQTEKNKLQSLVDAMEDNVTIRDTEYNIIYQNKPSLINSGGDRRGEKCYRATEGRDTVCEGCPVEKAFKDGKSHTAVRSIEISGEVTFWENIANPIRDAQGKIVSCLEIGRDITEHTQAEEALKQSEERYRTILEEMEDAYFEVDLGGHFTFVNNSVCRDLGYSKEELMGMSYKKITVEEDIESVFQIFNEVYQSGVPNKGFPWRTIRKDGSHGFAETSVSTLQNDKNEIIGFRGVGRDITDRNKSEEKLRQSEENYRALFDSSVIGTIVLDAETMRIVMINQAALKILGFSYMEEALEVDPYIFVPPEDREKYLEIARNAVSQQNSHEIYEIRAVTKDGRKIWANATATMIMHKGKSACLISFTDITEQKEQNEQLMMTDRLASLGELASGAAHELNNPLTSIIGFSQLLMEKEVPDDIREDLKLVHNEAQRAVIVTNNLLSFARKHAPVKQLYQINNIIEDVLELRDHEHMVNHIDVERHLAPNLPEIMVDYFQMQQVFMNIIINAEYFMIKTHNAGTLTITTKKENNTVRISFADDGPGISPENLGRIFDPFFTTKEAGSGTGLGLSICHGIVNEHGGQIYVRSQLGKGATIFIELPIKKLARIKNLLEVS